MESRMAMRALSLSSWSDPTQGAGSDLGLTPREPHQGIALGGIWGGAERVQTGEPAGPLGRTAAGES